MRDAVRLTRHRGWLFTTRPDRCATSVCDERERRLPSSKSSSGRRMAGVVLQVALEEKHDTPSGMEALATCSGYATAVRLSQEQHVRAGDSGGAERPGRDRAALCPPMANGREEYASWARCSADKSVVAEGTIALSDQAVCELASGLSITRYARAFIQSAEGEYATEQPRGTKGEASRRCGPLPRSKSSARQFREARTSYPWFERALSDEARAILVEGARSGYWGGIRAVTACVSRGLDKARSNSRLADACQTNPSALVALDRGLPPFFVPSHTISLTPYQRLDVSRSCACPGR